MFVQIKRRVDVGAVLDDANLYGVSANLQCVDKRHQKRFDVEPKLGTDTVRRIDDESDVGVATAEQLGGDT